MAATVFPPEIESLIDINHEGGLFFFYSEESYILKELKYDITISFKKQDSVDIIFLDYGDDKENLKEAISVSKEIGFFCAKKVIILEHVEKLNDKERQIIENLIKNPEPDNFLFIFFSEIDKRTKFFKELVKDKKRFFHIPYPSKKELQTFILERFVDVKPDSQLISWLAEQSGGDLFHISTEVEKLRLFAQSRDKKVLKLAEAQELMTGISEEKIYRIIDLLSTGQKKEGISLYRNLKITESEYKVHPMLILIFVNYFKALLNIKIMLKNGQEREIPSYLKQIRAFNLVYKFKQVARAYKNKQIIDALGEISRMELGMKGAAGIPISDLSVMIEQFMIHNFQV